MRPKPLRPAPPDNAQAYEEMPWSFDDLRRMVAALKPELRQALARRALWHRNDRYDSVKTVLRYVNETREEHEGSRTRSGVQVDASAIEAAPVLELGRLPIVVARGKAIRRITIARHGHPVAPPRPGFGVARGQHLASLVEQSQRQAGIWERGEFLRKSHDFLTNPYRNWENEEHRRVCLKGWRYA